MPSPATAPEMLVNIFLASLPGLLVPDNDTKNALGYNLMITEKDPQEHEYTIVAFHPWIFGYRCLYFSQRMAVEKVLHLVIFMITYLKYNRHSPDRGKS